MIITGNCPSEEQRNYIEYLEKKYNRKLSLLDIMIQDDDFVDLNFEFVHRPFERIRRITGYLVGTLDQWNNGKRAEEDDRVKHGVSGEFMSKLP